MQPLRVGCRTPSWHGNGIIGGIWPGGGPWRQHQGAQQRGIRNNLAPDPPIQLLCDGFVDWDLDTGGSGMLNLFSKPIRTIHLARYVREAITRGDNRSACTPYLLEFKVQPLRDKSMLAKQTDAVPGSMDRKTAHALNNIFSIIIANAEILEEELGPDNRCLQRIHLACSRGHELVRQLRGPMSEQPVSPDRGVDPAGLRSMLLLVIDDEVGIIEVISRYMKKYSAAVQGFTDGNAALRYFREHVETIDLVITDLDMPEVSGMDICRAVKTARPDMPVVVITGYDRELSEEQTAELGVAEVVIKPFTRQKLVSALCRALQP